MRLADLNPSVTWLAELDRYVVAFDCPNCGKPYRIVIHAHRAAPTPGVWQITFPATITGDGWDGFTLQPSIINPNHGRKKQCGYHCSVIDGSICT